MKHNPLRDGIRNREDAKVVLRYFFWIVCAVPIIEMVLWVLTIYANRGFILRPSVSVALLALIIYSQYKQTKKDLFVNLCVGVTLLYWVVRFYEEYMTSTSPIRPFANLIPLLLTPLLFKAAKQVKEAIRLMQD